MSNLINFKAFCKQPLTEEQVVFLAEQIQAIRENYLLSKPTELMNRETMIRFILKDSYFKKRRVECANHVALREWCIDIIVANQWTKDKEEMNLKVTIPATGGGNTGEDIS